MDENKKPPNFDWVAARTQCSIQDVFEELRSGIKQDVEARNKSLSDRPDAPKLKFTDSGRVARATAII